LHIPFPHFLEKSRVFRAGRAKLLFAFVLAGETSMKSLSFLLLPAIAILFSACGGPEPGGPVYGGPGYTGPAYGYGPGPNPQPGYYWNGAVYVQGQAPWYHNNDYHRNVTDVNDVNVNRTNINDRTVNNTTVNNTSVNDRTINKRNINKTNVNRTNVNQANVKVAPRRHKVEARPTPNP
jgi:hypothetical protein